MHSNRYILASAAAYLVASTTALGQTSSDTIDVVEATYGMNCKAHRTIYPIQNVVRLGNATKAIADACNGKTTVCAFAIDVHRLGDPANGCQKDFVVRWNCGKSVSKEKKVEPEAHGKTVEISCP
jgi:hypothetical protein